MCFEAHMFDVPVHAAVHRGMLKIIAWSALQYQATRFHWRLASERRRVTALFPWNSRALKLETFGERIILQSSEHHWPAIPLVSDFSVWYQIMTLCPNVSRMLETIVQLKAVMEDLSQSMAETGLRKNGKAYLASRRNSA